MERWKTGWRDGGLGGELGGELGGRHNGELGGEMEDKCGKTARGSHADAPWEPERMVQPVP